MPIFKNYIFDLDGTLTDSGVGIKNSIKYALNKEGLPIPQDDVLNQFIGPPLLDSFKMFCGADGEQAKRLLVLYREYFSVYGCFENTVYSDTETVLHTLKERGAKIFLATSKPEVFAIKILKHFSLFDYFDFCAGSDLGESRPTKASVINYLLSECSLSAADCIMIGDRKYDIEGAKNAQIKSAGVLCGYGSREEFKDADYIFDTLSGVLTI